MKRVKNIYIIGLLLIAVSCKKNDNEEKIIPCIPSGLSNNVIAFYPFSNGSLNDMSGNQHHLTNPTSATSSSDRNGNTNCAYEFKNIPSSSEFLTTTSTSFLNNLNEFSISLWYQPKDSTRNGGDFECLINRGLNISCPDRNGQWSVALYDCRKAVFGRTNSVWDNNIINNFNCQEEVNNRTGNWNHLVATFKQNGVEMKIYRNNVLQASSMGDIVCDTGTPSCQDIGDLFLGKDYTGKIDDLIIFNKALSQQEINDLFNMETCCEE
tara:strand:- start:158 stop:958 length:801 start_codon:yes stop_codon:yes gene_type:complete